MGFSNASHGDRLLQEVREGAARPTTGKPANVQEAIARRLIADPSHTGVAAALDLIRIFIEGKEAGFDTVIDLAPSSRYDPSRPVCRPWMKPWLNARKRSYARPLPNEAFEQHYKAMASNDNVLIMACDKTRSTMTSTPVQDMWRSVVAKRIL